MILIKNSTVIDGTGEPGAKKDILVKDGRIVAIGSLPNQQAETVIDAMGMTTTPGFIDINTDSDHYLSLFTDPVQQDFLLQGVTTIFGGHCGSSLAPLIRGSLESIRKWGDTNLVNVNWHTMSEFLRTLDKLGLGVNFGTLVGHSTVRRGILGETLRDLTAPELDMMRSVIEQALEDGAFGVSTGLGYNHTRNAPYAEVKMVAELAARADGVYATHLRNEREGLVEATREAISVAKETKARTLISHFRSIIGFEQNYQDALKLIENSEAKINFDAYPFDYSIVPIYTLLPEWAQHGSLEQMQALIADESSYEELHSAFLKIRGSDIVVARAPGFDFLVGKTVAAYAKAQEITAAKGLLSLMRQTKLRAVVFKKNINFDATMNAMLSPNSFVASNSPSLLEGRNVIENERAAKTFAKYLEGVRKSPTRSLEAAIQKITSAPAQFFGLQDRGVLREGAIADIAVLNGSRAVHVLVGGQLAVHDGNIQSGLHGKILRHNR